MLLLLAQRLTQGRSQAITLTLALMSVSILFWPSAILATAAIAFITLRQGAKEGLLIGLWALLPAVLMAIFLASSSQVLLLTAGFAASYLLGATRSWPLSLLLLSVFGLACSTWLTFIASAGIEAQVQMLSQSFAEMATANGQATPHEGLMFLSGLINKPFLAGLIGANIVLTGFLSIAIARSWQAKLYNPGGFQQEFHQLRLGKVELLILIALTLLLLQLGKDYLTWAAITLLPLLIAGVAVFHALAYKKQLSKSWYVLFYIALLWLDPLKAILVTVAAVDSFKDIRKLFRSRQNNQ